MARGLNMVFLVVLAVTALIQSSVAQTTFQVGDALGWTIPPNTAAYSTWASNKTFTLNDILGKITKFQFVFSSSILIMII